MSTFNPRPDPETCKGCGLFKENCMCNVLDKLADLFKRTLGKNKNNG